MVAIPLDSSAARRSASWRRQRERGLTLVLLLPGLLGFGGLFLYPILVTIATSLHPINSNAWTLDNYATFLGSAKGWGVMGLTFVLSVSATVFSVVISVPLALILREEIWGRRFFRVLILTPLMIPSLIGVLGLLLIFRSTGWINLFLTQVLQVIAEPLRVNYTLGGLILFYIWMFFPFTALTTLSSLEGLDRSIEEAAEVVGANRWQVIWHIIVPLIIPGVLAGSIMTFLLSFGAFSVPLIAGGDNRPIAVTVYTTSAVYGQWEQAGAIAMVMAILQISFLMVYSSLLRRRRS
jgi:putative spermidine/putrescine transport system permease protein